MAEEHKKALDYLPVIISLSSVFIFDLKKKCCKTKKIKNLISSHDATMVRRVTTPTWPGVSQKRVDQSDSQGHFQVYCQLWFRIDSFQITCLANKAKFDSISLVNKFHVVHQRYVSVHVVNVCYMWWLLKKLEQVKQFIFKIFQPTLVQTLCMIQVTISQTFFRCFTPVLSVKSSGTFCVCRIVKQKRECTCLAM